MPSDPNLYTHPSPLSPYPKATTDPLPNDLNPADNKSFLNPHASSTPRSPAYTAFSAPITNDTRGGFDVHVYFLQANEAQLQFAKELWERIRREFPELRIYKVWERPIGPHPTGMFEVNLFTPEQFGAFIPWLLVNRGPLGALVHPNTGDDERDHSQRAMWLGPVWPLDLSMFKKNKAIKEFIASYDDGASSAS